ncbi:uncharacterized protein JCM6883_003821 [Sporobolomyces salmoneus]|uniref:uncharacterized protein n=1 Tax=Sporobolomyces salmoneus TaxID=183962 RepID=UPI0031823EB9
MVAAPETQVRPQEAVVTGQTTVEAIKQSNGKESFNSNEGQQRVNGFTVVDESTSSSPANESTESSTATHNLPPPDVARNIPCRFFPLGTCKYGEQCIFSHGIPGVAGSPGVPASPSVQPQVAPGQSQSPPSTAVEVQLSSSQGRSAAPQPQPQQQQQAYPHLQMMDQAYMQGVPMYYPDQSLQYGFQPPFSPEQGYYHFAPPPFQAYPQHYQQFAPHAYYAHPPPPPPPLPPVVPTPLSISAQSSRPAPSSVDTPVNPSPAPSPSQVIESTPIQQQSTESSQQVPESTTESSSPQGIAPASLHTFFQTAASMPPSSSPSVPVSTTSPISAPLPLVSSQASPNGFVKQPLPGRLPGPRRSIGGMPTNAYPQGVSGLQQGGGGGKPRRSFGGSRPPCSFFEANRCKNGDECSFVHLLPDGTDARSLGRGMIGSDGRTDSPEASGGVPPAWLLNQKALRFSGGNGSGMKKHAEMMNGSVGAGGYSYRERPHQGRRARYEEEQQQQQQQQQQQHARYPNGANQLVEGQAQFQPALLAQPLQNGVAPRPVLAVDGSLAGRIPPGGGGTPQLVAAINGLTRRIPPAHLQPQPSAAPHQHDRPSAIPLAPASSDSQNAPPPRSREPSQQRIPTVNDFPALGSPALEKESSTSPLETTPAPAQDTVPVSSGGDQTSNEKEAPLSSPAVENDGFVMVSHDDAKPSPSSTPAPASSSVSPPATEQQEPVASTSAPTAPPASSPAQAVRPAQPPKFTMSFASIAKAASNSAAVSNVPEKKNAKPSPQNLNKPTESKPLVESVKADVKNVKKDTEEEGEKDQDDGFITKTSKKSKKSSAAANKMR